MADPKQDNWRTNPAFNYEFETFAECVQLAVVEFSKRPSVIFLLLKHNIHPVWLCLPWTQYRSAPADHPCHSSTIIFRGNFFEMRKLAYSIPPDLFSAAIVPDEDNIKPEADAIHDDALKMGAETDNITSHSPTNPAWEDPTPAPDKSNGSDPEPDGSIDA